MCLRRHLKAVVITDTVRCHSLRLSLTNNALSMAAFLLFEEPSSGFDIPQDAVERKAEFDDRWRWNAESFARKNGLKLVGANFFLTERK
jgi:hypothetical protein